MRVDQNELLKFLLMSTILIVVILFLLLYYSYGAPNTHQLCRTT